MRMSAESTNAKYVAIADALQTRWRDLPPGVQLPAERALADDFGVSPLTLRKALNLLDSRGIVDRISRRGTFVAPPRIHKTPELSSFSQEMRDRGLTPSSRLLGVARRAASPAAAAALALREGGLVLEIERLRFADGEPISLQVSCLPPQLHDRLTSEELEGSLHAALTRLGHRPTTGTRTARAVALGPREAMLLGLPDGSPALEMIHVHRDGGQMPVEWARSLFHPDRYEVAFEVRLPTKDGR